MIKIKQLITDIQTKYWDFRDKNIKMLECESKANIKENLGKLGIKDSYFSRDYETFAFIINVLGVSYSRKIAIWNKLRPYMPVQVILVVR